MDYKFKERLGYVARSCFKNRKEAQGKGAHSKGKGGRLKEGGRERRKPPLQSVFYRTLLIIVFFCV